MQLALMVCFGNSAAAQPLSPNGWVAHSNSLADGTSRLSPSQGSVAHQPPSLPCQRTLPRPRCLSPGTALRSASLTSLLPLPDVPHMHGPVHAGPCCYPSQLPSPPQSLVHGFPSPRPPPLWACQPSTSPGHRRKGQGGSRPVSTTPLHPPTHSLQLSCCPAHPAPNPLPCFSFSARLHDSRDGPSFSRDSLFVRWCALKSLAKRAFASAIASRST